MTEFKTFTSFWNHAQFEKQWHDSEVVYVDYLNEKIYQVSTGSAKQCGLVKSIRKKQAQKYFIIIL